MIRHCLTLDLKNEPEAIAAYEAYHREVPEPILLSLQESGILSMEIYRYQTRLFMIMETKDDFSFSAKGQADAANPEVQAWETLMDQYQQRLEGTAPGEKWVLMNQLFKWNTDGTD